jgi:hypothetical protein
MALESPLFQSSMELFGHSITHFNGTEELDRKLLILHIANAIELILKDVLLDIGESIYKNPKETVTINGCIETLKSKGVSIPYLNKIELLIDERNAIQHRFGYPNELTSIFYMNIAVDFFRDILKNHYNQDFDEVIAQFAREKDLMSFRMRKPSNESELDNLKKLSKIHPLGALLSAMSYLEGKIDEFANDVGLKSQLRMRPPWLFMSPRFLHKFGIDLPAGLDGEIDELRRIRNLAAHGRKDPTKQEVDRCISAIEKYERALEAVDKNSVRNKTKQIQEDRDREKQEEIRDGQQINSGDGKGLGGADAASS